MADDAAPMTITPEAARRLQGEADFSRAVLSVRHLLGCGATGFRISVEENAPDEGRRFEVAGIPVVMDEYSFTRLKGAVRGLAADAAGEGYRLDHPDAVMTTFCCLFAGRSSEFLRSRRWSCFWSPRRRRNPPPSAPASGISASRPASCRPVPSTRSPMSTACGSATGR